MSEEALAYFIYEDHIGVIEMLKILASGFGVVYLAARLGSFLWVLMSRSGYAKTRNNVGIWSVHRVPRIQAYTREASEDASPLETRSRPMPSQQD